MQIVSLMNEKDKYHFFKEELSELLKETKLVSFYNDKKAMNSIITLLVENKSTNTINEIIVMSEKEASNNTISKEQATKVFEEIIEWWNDTKDFID